MTATPWLPPPAEGRPAWRTDTRYPQLVVNAATGQPVALFLDPDTARQVTTAVCVLAEDLPLSCAIDLGWQLRVGGKVPHHVYRQEGPLPDRRPFPEGDPPLGMFVNPVDAAWAVLAVRLQPTLRWLL